MTRGKRRGATSLLAMLFLVLFSTLAVGFFASTTTTVQIAANERRATAAQLAAESGMDFLRLHLGAVHIPVLDDPWDTLATLHAGLAQRLEGTENLDDDEIGWDGARITIPPIDIGDGSAFSASIELDDPDAGQDVRVTVSGIASDTGRRTVSMLFRIRPQYGSVLDYGLASRSVVILDSNARVMGDTDPARGSILSTTWMDYKPVQVLGNSAVSGDIASVNPDADIPVDPGASVAGFEISSMYQDHIHLGIAEPEFPVIDTSAFKPYATTVLSAYREKYKNRTLKNVLVKADTHPTFAGGTEIQGVMYIETPNHVRFDGNVTVRGVVAVQNHPTGYVYGNAIEVRGRTDLLGIETLPDKPDFPPELRDLTGSSILAPNFMLHLNGSIGTAAGSIVASMLWLDNGAAGTIHGSLINLDDTSVVIAGNANVRFAAPPHQGRIPAGMRFGGSYAPDISTYTEGR